MNGSGTERLVGHAPFRDVIVPGKVNCGKTISAGQKNMLIATATTVSNMVEPQSLLRTTCFIRGSPFFDSMARQNFHRDPVSWKIPTLCWRGGRKASYSRACPYVVDSICLCRCVCACAGTITREFTEDFTDFFSFLSRVRKIVRAFRGMYIRHICTHNNHIQACAAIQCHPPSTFH